MSSSNSEKKFQKCIQTFLEKEFKIIKKENIRMWNQAKRIKDEQIAAIELDNAFNNEWKLEERSDFNPSKLVYFTEVKPMLKRDFIQYSDKNVVTPDELQLRNIPYINTNTEKMDEKMLKSLESVYKNNIREPILVPLEDDIDNLVLLELIRRASRVFQNFSTVCIVISQIFPNIGKPEYIEKMVKMMLDAECFNCYMTTECFKHGNRMDFNNNDSKAFVTQTLTAAEPVPTDVSTYGMKSYQGRAYSLDFKHIPCNHPGHHCNSGTCRCMALGMACEILCKCSSTCDNEIQGCGCPSTEKCWGSVMCPCYNLNRECNPRCGGCCSTETEDKICGNKNVQEQINNNLNIKIVCSESMIHGWGAFLMMDVEKNEFLCEYVGEIISESEVQRRSVTYAAKKSSYIFEINSEEIIDSNYLGNVSRFINHSSNPNCKAKKIIVGGQIKLIFVATEKMIKGTELTLNYRNRTHSITFGLKNYPAKEVKVIDEKLVHHGWLHYE